MQAHPPIAVNSYSYRRRSLFSDLRMEKELSGHAGCVNTLSWNREGSILASGSDDLRVFLWRFPDCLYKDQSASFATGHAGNIFCAKFIPDNESVMVTCAADGQVRLFDVANEAGKLLASYSCHSARVKKVAFEHGNPYVFLSCSEDGTVRQHDIRATHHCREGCQSPVVSLNYAINSISSSACNPAYFAVGGYDPYVRVYDRRFVSAEPGSFVRKIRPERSSKLVTAVKFYKESYEILANYSSDAVYLWSSDSLEADSVQTARSMSCFENEFGNLERLYEDGAAAFQLGRFSQAIQIFQAIVQILRSPPFVGENDLVCIMECNLAICHLRRREAADLKESSELINSALALCPRNERAGYLRSLVRTKRASSEAAPVSLQPAVPGEASATGQRSAGDIDDLIDGMGVVVKLRPFYMRMVSRKRDNFDRRYWGSCNERTIKDVSFIGDRLVSSGSDGGYFVIWEKETADIVFVGRSDRSVVNCVEAHPSIPTIAVSGIDHTVKLWSPASVCRGSEYEPVPKDEVPAFVANYASAPPAVYCQVQ